MAILSLITYGKGDFFDKNKFQPVKNTPYWNKPSGGLWASPINCNYGWKEWCIIEEFGDLSSNFKFSITGNIFKIKIDNLNKLPLITNNSREFPIYTIVIDFEAAVNSGIDAIWLTESNIRHKSFYGWDCESVLILNPNCIQI
jgi:hypothetical protein